MGFCKGTGPKIKGLLKKIDKKLNSYADAALYITGALKPWITGPAGQLITDIIPGTWDNELREKASTAISVAIDKISIAKEIAAEPNFNKKVHLFLDELAKQNPDSRDAVLFKLAALITKYMHGEQLSQSEYDLITQALYLNKKDAANRN